MSAVDWLNLGTATASLIATGLNVASLWALGLRKTAVLVASVMIALCVGLIVLVLL